MQTCESIVIFDEAGRNYHEAVRIYNQGYPECTRIKIIEKSVGFYMLALIWKLGKEEQYTLTFVHQYIKEGTNRSSYIEYDLPKDGIYADFLLSTI